MNFDPRITPARPDLAALHLQGRVEAARFVEGTLREVRDGQAPVRREPRPDAPLETEALHGERITVYEDNGEGWCWGQLQSDGYVGWIPVNALTRPGRRQPTGSRCCAVFCFQAVPSRRRRSMPYRSARMSPSSRTGDVRQPLTPLASGFFVPTRHLAPIATCEPDSSARQSVLSAFLTSGAARPASGSIARGWCRLP